MISIFDPGFAIQRRIMEFTRDDTNEHDVWSRKDLLKCKYDPGMDITVFSARSRLISAIGTYVTNHFSVISKTPNSIFMRGCFDPHQSPLQPKNVDNVVEIQAYLDNDRNVAVLKLRVATFDGTEAASEAEDPFGGFGGWLHRRYSTALVESGARSCME